MTKQRKKERVLQVSQRTTQRLLEALEKKYPSFDLTRKWNSVLEFCLYYSLCCVTSATAAKKVMRSLWDEDGFVDWNEVRVAQVQDIRAVLEARKISPAREISYTLKGTLAWLFVQFHTLDLEFLREEEKWDKLWKRFVQFEEDKKSEKLLYKADLPHWSLAAALLHWLYGAPLFPIGEEGARVCYRLGMYPPSTPVWVIAEELGDILPKKKLFSLHWGLVEHGKKTCGEEGTMKCKRCVISQQCLYYKVAKGKTDLSLEEVLAEGVSSSSKRVRKGR